MELGDRPLNQTQNLHGRIKEEREIRDVEQAKSRIIYLDYTKRGSS
jgi:hypothetical protein